MVIKIFIGLYSLGAVGLFTEAGFFIREAVVCAGKPPVLSCSFPVGLAVFVGLDGLACMAAAIAMIGIERDWW